MGRCLAQQDRYLESYNAFKQAIDFDLGVRAPDTNTEAISDCVDNMALAATKARRTMKDGRRALAGLFAVVDRYLREHGAGRTKDKDR